MRLFHVQRLSHQKKSPLDPLAPLQPLFMLLFGLKLTAFGNKGRGRGWIGGGRQAREGCGFVGELHACQSVSERGKRQRLGNPAAWLRHARTRTRTHALHGHQDF